MVEALEKGVEDSEPAQTQIATRKELNNKKYSFFNLPLTATFINPAVIIEK